VNLSTLATPLETMVKDAQVSIQEDQSIDEVVGTEIRARFPKLQALHQILIQPIAELNPV
jgi:hypothetical protein